MTEDSPNLSNYLNEEGFSGFILELIREINASFQRRGFLCVDILSRKLIEIMVINILIKNPGPKCVWKDGKKNIILNFYHLLTSFWEKVESEYKLYLPSINSPTLKELKNTSWIIKKTGDYNAHNVGNVPNYEQLIRNQIKFQNLVNFLSDIIQKIPQDNKILTSDQNLPRGDLKNFQWKISCPSHFPHPFESPLTEFYDFDIEFELTNLNPFSMDLYIYIKSDSQSVCFMRDEPLKRFSWRKLKRVAHNVTLDISEKDCISSSLQTKFIFNGVYRPHFVRPFQKKITLRYRINASSVGTKETHYWDTKYRRIVIPIQKPPKRS